MRYLFIFLLFINIASANVVIKYGVNIPKENESLGRTKTIFLSYQNMIFSSLIEQYEIGGWADNSSLAGRKSSLLASYSLGFNVNTDSLFIQALCGPSFISTPDSNLGGIFQFNNDIAFGLRDKQNDTRIGLSYKHISSAGIYSPNLGRDFIMFHVSIPILK